MALFLACQPSFCRSPRGSLLGFVFRMLDTLFVRQWISGAVPSRCRKANTPGAPAPVLLAPHLQRIRRRRACSARSDSPQVAASWAWPGIHLVNQSELTIFTTAKNNAVRFSWPGARAIVETGKSRGSHSAPPGCAGVRRQPRHRTRRRDHVRRHQSGAFAPPDRAAIQSGQAPGGFPRAGCKSENVLCSRFDRRDRRASEQHRGGARSPRCRRSLGPGTSSPEIHRIGPLRR